MNRIGAMIAAGGVLAAFGAACSAPGGGDATASASQGIVGGRPSGDSEDASLYLETRWDGGGLRCTATLVAPNLAMAARHCLLNVDNPIDCSPDGTLSPGAVAPDLTPAAPAEVSVYYGADKTNFLGSAHGVAIVTSTELTLCKADLGFVVLDHPLAQVHVPIRLAPLAIGDLVDVAGWGYTSDDRTALPTTRYAVDGVRVNDVGPGDIPPGMFQLPGNTICYGDSGAAAMVGGAVVGIDSRITGATDTTTCTETFIRNLFTTLSANKDTIERGFAAAGLTPWYEGEPPPPDAGADAEPAAASSPAEPAGPAGNGSCAISRRTTPRESSPLAIVGIALGIALIRRRSRA